MIGCSQSYKQTTLAHLDTSSSIPTIVAQTNNSAVIHDISQGSVPIVENGTDSNISEINQNVDSNKRALRVTSVNHHEDTEVLVSIDLSQLEDLEQYSSIGAILLKDDAVIDHKSLKAIGDLQVYTTVFPNLESSTEYSVCLTGIKNLATTGYFYCKNITTASRQDEEALVVLNYDVSDEIRSLVDEWSTQVSKKNPSIRLSIISLERGTTPEELYSTLQQAHKTSHLSYVVLVGYDLPIPYISNQIRSVSQLQSLTFNTKVKDTGFGNDDNSLHEVSIAVIKGKDDAEISRYFRRIVAHYQIPQPLSKDVLIADAMTPTESSLIDTYFTLANGQNTPITRIEGIRDYSNNEEATRWQEKYKEELKKDYGLLIINAHGAPDFHYPCTFEKCITDAFIRENPPRIPIIVAISCNVGNFMTAGSPMISYIFSGESLAGIGSDVFYVDSNGYTAKEIYKKLQERKNLGQVARPFGLIIFGDPFITTN